MKNQHTHTLLIVMTLLCIVNSGFSQSGIEVWKSINSRYDHSKQICLQFSVIHTKPNTTQILDTLIYCTDQNRNYIKVNDTETISNKGKVIKLKHKTKKILIEAPVVGIKGGNSTTLPVIFSAIGLDVVTSNLSIRTIDSLNREITLSDTTSLTIDQLIIFYAPTYQITSIKIVYKTNNSLSTSVYQVIDIPDPENYLKMSKYVVVSKKGVKSKSNTKSKKYSIDDKSDKTKKK